MKLGIFSLISLIPLILKAINTAEVVFGPGTGTEKKQFVMDMLRELFKQLPQIFGEKANAILPFESLEGLISSVIDIAVKLLNLLGVFKKAAPAAV